MLKQISIPEDKNNSINDIGCSTIEIDDRQPIVNSYVQKLREKTLNQIEIKEFKEIS